MLKLSGKSKLAIIGLVILIAGATGCIYFWKGQNITFPKSISKQMDFPLYYPSNLPLGYTIDRSSLKIPQRNTLIFNIQSPGKPLIGVSEQPLPPDLNLSSKQSAPQGVRLPTTNFATSIGQATIDQWGEKKVSYIVTGHTWIIINVTRLDDETIRALSRAFVPS